MAKSKKNRNTADGVDSKLECDICHQIVNVGTGGMGNLMNHKSSACKGPPKGKMQQLTSFFQRKPTARLVPSTVASAPLVSSGAAEADDINLFAQKPYEPPDGFGRFLCLSGLSLTVWVLPVMKNAQNQQPLEPSAAHTPKATRWLVWLLRNLSIEAKHMASSSRAGSPSLEAQDVSASDNNTPNDATLEKPTISALNNLRLKMEEIPPHLRGNSLTEFTRDPANFLAKSKSGTIEELLHNLLQRTFGGESWNYNLRYVRQYLYRGPNGLDGFCNFFEYFVLEHRYSLRNISDILLFLEEGIDQEFSHLNHDDTTVDIEILDLPRRFNSGTVSPCMEATVTVTKTSVALQNNPHTSYPFALHAENSLHWGYELRDESMFLRATDCFKTYTGAAEQCRACLALPSDSVLQGIAQRMQNGVHENSKLAFHPIANLIQMHRRLMEQLREKRLIQLNDARTIMRKITTIDNQKELTMAIASGKIMRVSHVLAAGYRNGAGTKGLIQLCQRAAEGKYKPRNDEQEKVLQLAFLRVGGSRLAEISHRALGLPSVTTTRRSPSDEDLPSIVHQVAMLDEIAIEARPRYDDRTNMVIGICRQHAHKLPLAGYDLNVLCNGVKEGKAHLAREATVAALGLLTPNPRLYAARPILFSADCKKESDPQHAVNVLLPSSTS
ncbi:hypothetical protein R3P38DRAFT_3205451 [Favolaschia claudopus]|uniref:Uncharacterized protein n=1 Tax=Favolaschia claudopus TaxID=2862362 RepID=A0AAW0AN47_9AGAR